MRGLSVLLVLGLAARLAAAPPELLDDRYELSLFAEHPLVRTPVGCVFDQRSDSLLVIESHTHFRPDNYDGPERDRILRLKDEDGDGMADAEPEVFYEGGKHMMSVAMDSANRTYVATRSQIFRLSIPFIILDENGLESVRPAQRTEPLIRLETTGEYPHNGLCGMVITEDTLYFGLGENLGHPYELIAEGGNTLKGGGEGGNIYSYDFKTKTIIRLATGFWNPFGLCLDDRRNLFAVDNDPDSRPPNRLLHVVPGGDYGYQFRYGRSGKHPLQAWNGELPGTLPMMAGTGEAASDILKVGKELWVTSWGHHRIESCTPQPAGATFTAPEMKTIVKGDNNFRPVAFAHASDGSIYFTDWVDKSYPIHGKGRVWKLTPKNYLTIPKPVASRNALLDAHSNAATDTEILKRLNDADAFARTRAVWELTRRQPHDIPAWKDLNAAGRSALISALRWKKWPEWEVTLELAIKDKSPEVQLAAVRTIADEKLATHKDTLKKMRRQGIEHERLFDAITATLKVLGEDTDQSSREQWLLETVNSKSLSVTERVAALQQISPTSKLLKINLLESLATAPDNTLRGAAVWHLMHRTKKDTAPALQRILTHDNTGDATRADIEAIYFGRGKAPASHPRRTLATWLAEIPKQRGIVRAGRRVFHSDKLGMCARCHVHSGYGTAVGPDLTGIGTDKDLSRLLESILHPNKEISPHYSAQLIKTTDGSLHVGIPQLVTGRGGTGSVSFVGVDGKPFEIALADIIEREPWITSLMPEGLDARLNVQQMRDLVAFLQIGVQKE